VTNIVAVLIVRCTHTGFYKDGRPNPASVTLYDLDEITIQKNRTRAVPVTVGGFVDIPMSTRTFISFHDGAICKHVKNGEITAEIILQLRDKSNCGGPAGTGQALRPAVLNIERAGNELRFVIPNNVLPTVLDSVGFLVGEPLTITGLTGAFSKLNGEYVITEADPGMGLAGADASSYLVVVDSEGPDIAAATLTGVNLCLTEGRVTSQFGSNGDVGGLGDNVFGYVGGLLLPHAIGGGGAALSILDEGILVDAGTTSIDFVGAGVAATPAGPGAVTVTIPGGAPVGAEYVVMSLDATLTDERVLTAGTGILITDGGANGPVTLAVDFTVVVPTTRTITAGDGLIGGGDLSADRTIDAVAHADGSIVVNANDIQVGVLATDAQHGARGGGTQHALVDATAAGFQPQSNRSAAVAPVATDDSASGYAVGSYWIDLVTNTAYVCVDALVGAAIWTSTTAAGGGTTAVVQWGNDSSGNNTTTRYLDPGYEARVAPLAPLQIRAPRGGTIRNLHVRHNSTGGTGATITYTVRVNGAASGVAVALASTTANGADLVSTVAVAQGDLIDIEVTKVAAAGGGNREPTATVEIAA
jgi:hypothetical protein